MWLRLETYAKPPWALSSSILLTVAQSTFRENCCIPGTYPQSLEVVFHIPCTLERDHAEQPPCGASERLVKEIQEEGKKLPGMSKTTVSTKRCFSGCGARWVVAGRLLRSCASSATVWMDETVLFDVLGSYPADLISIADAQSQEIWREKTGDGDRGDRPHTSPSPCEPDFFYPDFHHFSEGPATPAPCCSVGCRQIKRGS